MKVFGIDIIKGSVRSRTRRPVYALCVMEDGGITAEHEVNAFRLKRMLAVEKPDILAVDSLQEISPDQKGLFAWMADLPGGTRLVQVTGGERPETLGKVAARFHIRFDRFDPHAEARTIARLAGLGAGVEVVAYDKQCDIVVSRHRSIGKGGWSQNRYTKRIHGAVQQKAREIETKLKEEGLRYEKQELPAFGGYSRAIFRVGASRDVVPVGSYRGPDIQVRVTGRRLDRIRFAPRSGKTRHLIVGIDPGTTTAIAALDLEGHLVLLTSSRQMAMSDVIEEIYHAGRPLIIASDVEAMPFSVEKIRRAFSAVAHTPKQDLSVETKQETTQPFGYANVHERDALSAALDAYRQNKNKFQNIAKRLPPGFDLDEVRARVLRGKSLDSVLEELTAGPAPVEKKEPEQTVEPERDERVAALEGTVKRLKAYIGDLQTDLEERDEKIGEQQRLLEMEHTQARQKMMESAEIAKSDAIIRNLKRRLRKAERANRKLKKRLDQMRTIADIGMSEDDCPVKVLESFTRDGLRALDEDLGVAEDDLLFVQRIEGWSRGVVRELSDRGIAALIVGSGPDPFPDPHLAQLFMEWEVPLFSGVSIGAEIRGKTGRVSRKRLSEALADWEESLGDFRRARKLEKVEEIFREYRHERVKEVKRSG